MIKSIMQTDRKCWVCGATNNLHQHEIFFGRGRRNKSIMFGCTVYLCGPHHNLSDHGVHFDPDLDLRLKQECQRKWMETYGKDTEEFIKAFGRSYL